MLNLKRMLFALSLLAVAAIVVFFVLENRQSVVLVLFGWSAPAVPLAIPVLVALLLGLAVGPVLGAYVAIRSRRRSNRSNV